MSTNICSFTLQTFYSVHTSTWTWRNQSTWWRYESRQMEARINDWYAKFFWTFTYFSIFLIVVCLWPMDFYQCLMEKYFPVPKKITKMAQLNVSKYKIPQTCFSTTSICTELVFWRKYWKLEEYYKWTLQKPNLWNFKWSKTNPIWMDARFSFTYHIQNCNILFY